MSKEEYRVGRTVIDKKSFDKTINTDFEFYTDPIPVEDTDTVEELFRLYEKLYLEVPLEGDLSHTTLIERSSELVQVDNTNEIIEPLLEEISELRSELLEKEREILNFQIDQSKNNIP